MGVEEEGVEELTVVQVDKPVQVGIRKAGSSEEGALVEEEDKLVEELVAWEDKGDEAGMWTGERREEDEGEEEEHVVREAEAQYSC